MKEIKAFIKPKRVQVVVESLRDAGFESVTLSKGEGTGAHKDPESRAINMRQSQNARTWRWHYLRL